MEKRRSPGAARGSGAGAKEEQVGQKARCRAPGSRRGGCRWGGAESRGNGARPVELMIMNDTCATHRSCVLQRSFGRIKGRATTVKDERGPGQKF